MKRGEYDYRRAYGLIHLPENGRVPIACETEAVTVAQFDERVATLEKLSHQIWAAPRAALIRSFCEEVTGDEVARAWRLWMQSHHSFFCNFGILSYAYDRLVESAISPSSASARRWAEDVAALWRSAGALMTYGVDFHPTQKIYCTYIREEMPKAFSGFWLREWIEVRKASRTWEEMVSASASPDFSELQRVVKNGLHTYHNYHATVMQAAVPEGRSLAMDYRQLNGCAHPITEREFVGYDSWFRIVRGPQARWEFVEITCREFARTLGEITQSSALAEAPLKDLHLGFRTALRIFGSWLGPIPIASKYYPRTLRGE